MELERTLPGDVYARLVEPGYRAALRDDSDAFAENVRLYESRPLYTGLARLFLPLGAARGLHLLSGVCVVLGLWGLWVWASDLLPRVWSFPLAPLAWIFGVIELARTASPDSLFFALAMWGLVCLQRGLTLGAVACLWGMVATRPDWILWVLPLCLWWMRHGKTPRMAALSGIGALLLYMGIQGLWPGLGWAGIFRFTLIELQVYPLSTPVHLSLWGYAEAVKEGLRALLYADAPIVAALCALAALWAGKGAVEKHWRELAWVLIGVVVLRFLLFPVWWERFWAAPFLVLSVLALHALQARGSMSQPATTGVPTGCA
jgi:hypothetical protein